MEEEIFKLSTNDENFSLDVLKTLIEKDIPFSYSNNTIVVNRTNLSEEQREAIETQRPKKFRQLKSLCKECSVIRGESKLTEDEKSFVKNIFQERVGLRPIPPKTKESTSMRSPKPIPSPKRTLSSSPKRLPLPKRPLLLSPKRLPSSPKRILPSSPPIVKRSTSSRIVNIKKLEEK